MIDKDKLEKVRKVQNEKIINELFSDEEENKKRKKKLEKIFERIKLRKNGSK